jgi:RNA recognition motif-containing protein
MIIHMMTLQAPGKDAEVFIGNLPMDMYEDVLIPVLEAFGTLRECRLKMDPASGLGRGFAFVVYTDAEEAR